MHWVKDLWLRNTCRKRFPASSNKVNLGCGIHYHQAWDNYDFEPAESGVRRIDLSRPLPFRGDSYEVCYMSHVLEHLQRQRVPRLLSELLSILKPGGLLRLVVPDLETIARLYLSELTAALDGEDEAVQRHEWMTLELIDQMTRSFSGGFMGRVLHSRPLSHRAFIESRIGWEGAQWLKSIDEQSELSPQTIAPDQIYNCVDAHEGAEANFRQTGEVHRWMYDRVSLRRLLLLAGFSEIKVCAADESRIPDFASYCLDTDHAGRVRKPDSLFVEATADKHDSACR